MTSSMLSFLCSLLSFLPLDVKLHLNALRVRFLARWYEYFPTPASKHLCQVCKATLQSKDGGSAADGFLHPDPEHSGQQQFEIYGQVTCPHHASIQSLKDSASEGCMICSRVWSSVSDDPDQREKVLEALDLREDILTYCYITEAGHVDYDLMVQGGNNCLLASVAFPERVFPDAPKPETFILLPSMTMLLSTHWRLPSYSTGSVQSWYFATLWYQMCLKHHDSCNRKRLENSHGNQWYPTRLIKVSRWRNRLRLILTKEERPDAPYLTISHCWGKADFIQLTRSSMPDFLKDIPFRKLPKTFQDAISTARSLGVYYIWIDSLCIIQREESLADWKIEAARMDKVYSHALLNIAATGASDGSKGLFFPRQPDTMTLPEIRLDWSFRVKSSIRYTLLDYDYWKHLVVDEPLIRRAWVVQERLLAPRVLHCGSRQLFWECSSLDASEDFPTGLPIVLVRQNQQSLFKLMDEAVKHFAEGEHSTAAHAVWQRALSSYTHASLTKPEDKLIALAGIASELSPSFSDGYVAGLWKEFMATELLWYVDLNTVSNMQRKYRAPSFSWASVDGAVVPGGWQKDNILIEVLDAEAPAEISSSPFGSVPCGFVRLRGTLKRATLWPNLADKEGRHVARQARARMPVRKRHMDIGTSHRESMVEMQRWLLQLEDIHAPSNIEPKWSVYCREIYYDQETVPEVVEDTFFMIGADIYLDEELFPDNDEEPGDVYCMVVTGQSLSCRAVRGLILIRTGDADGEYQRIGMFVTAMGTR